MYDQLYFWKMLFTGPLYCMWQKTSWGTLCLSWNKISPEIWYMHTMYIYNAVFSSPFMFPLHIMIQQAIVAGPAHFIPFHMSSFPYTEGDIFMSILVFSYMDDNTLETWKVPLWGVITLQACASHLITICRISACFSPLPSRGRCFFNDINRRVRLAILSHEQ